MKSSVIKHSIVLNGHKTSISLEDQFWDGLREIAGRENITVSALVEKVDHGRVTHNLSSAIRVYVLAQFRPRRAELNCQPNGLITVLRQVPQKGLFSKVPSRPELDQDRMRFTGSKKRGSSWQEGVED